jgi:hypothetical protein
MPRRKNKKNNSGAKASQLLKFKGFYIALSAVTGLILIGIIGLAVWKPVIFRGEYAVSDLLAVIQGKNVIKKADKVPHTYQEGQQFQYGDYKFKVSQYSDPLIFVDQETFCNRLLEGYREERNSKGTGGFSVAYGFSLNLADQEVLSKCRATNYPNYQKTFQNKQYLNLEINIENTTDKLLPDNYFKWENIFRR